jgi:hypothetical protein
MVDEGGFIVARSVPHASESEWKAILGLLKEVPIRPESLAADSAFSVGDLRQSLDKQGITAYIPVHPKQAQSVADQGSFAYADDHLICPQGKILARRYFHHRDKAYSYVAHQKDCQACPRKAECLSSS